MDTPTRSTTSLSRAVATEIRVLLLRRDMNQAQLAERMGVNEMWVSRRLRGAQPLDLNDLQRFAEALNVKIVDLLPRDLTIVRSRVAERLIPAQFTPAASAERPIPEPVTVPDSPEQLTRCAPDVRSSAGGGIHARPKVRRKLPTLAARVTT